MARKSNLLGPGFLTSHQRRGLVAWPGRGQSQDLADRQARTGNGGLGGYGGKEFDRSLLELLTISSSSVLQPHRPTPLESPLTNLWNAREG